MSKNTTLIIIEETQQMMQKQHEEVIKQIPQGFTHPQRMTQPPTGVSGSYPEMTPPPAQ